MRLYTVEYQTFFDRPEWRLRRRTSWEMGEGAVRRLVVVSAFAILALVACGDSSDSGGSSAPGAEAAEAGKVPSELSTGGKMQVCVDPTYPPAEFTDTAGGTLQGFDIDMGEGIAKHLGLEVAWVNTKFDAIIPALTSKKCNLVISALTNSEERREIIDFVDYVSVGSAFLVPPGNPKGLTSIDDLCGTDAAMIIGENWKTYLDEQSAKCKTAGKSAVKVSEYNTSSDELKQLALGRVDLIVTNTLNGAYLVTQPPGKGSAELAKAEPFTLNALGIGVRKGEDEVLKVVTEAVQALYDSGEMEQFFVDQGVGDAFLPKRPEYPPVTPTASPS